MWVEVMFPFNFISWSRRSELAMGENASVKIEGGGGKSCYLYIVKIENFHPVLTSSLKLLDARSSNLFQLRAYIYQF